MKTIKFYCSYFSASPFQIASVAVGAGQQSGIRNQHAATALVVSTNCHYVRDLIRRDQEYQEQREALIKALVVGKKSGVAERTIKEIWRDVKARRSRNG